jgi:4'-phosphopantetheinyl transferase
VVGAPDLARDLLALVPLPAAGPARLWWVSLAVSPEAAAELRALLTEDERRRADGYPHAARGRRFAHGRAALRLLLGAAVSRDPRALRFSSNADGKPSLLEPLASSGGAPPEFNLSHAHDFALIAVSAEGPLGVDLSAVDRTLPVDKVAPRFFSAVERAALDSAPTHDARCDRFARLWVRKEAWLKGVGTGISERMRQTDFSAGIDRPVGDPATALPIEVEGWEVRDVAGVPDGYRAAVATRRGEGAAG